MSNIEHDAVDEDIEILINNMHSDEYLELEDELLQKKKIRINSFYKERRYIP
jgi:hypothetical protein